MLPNAMKNGILLLALLSANRMALAQKVVEPSTKSHPDWSKPYLPFQIAGNLYYIGTYDLACFLIATPDGNILINTGLAASAQTINQHIEKLGFKLSDTKILLTTQAHYDHVGAMAAIQKTTGAEMMVDGGDALSMADGGLSDYSQEGDERLFEPVKIGRILHDGDTITLGGVNLKVLHHPGHTKGSCSYLLEVQDEQRKYTVLIANMPTIVTDKKFSDIPTYPTIAKDYAYTFEAMKRLKFDIWLASHGSQFNLMGKHQPGSAYNPTAFIDRKGFDEALADLKAEYDRKLLEEDGVR